MLSERAVLHHQPMHLVVLSVFQAQVSGMYSMRYLTPGCCNITNFVAKLFCDEVKADSLTEYSL